MICSEVMFREKMFRDIHAHVHVVGKFTPTVTSYMVSTDQVPTLISGMTLWAN